MADRWTGLSSAVPNIHSGFYSTRQPQPPSATNSGGCWRQREGEAVRRCEAFWGLRGRRQSTRNQNSASLLFHPELCMETPLVCLIKRGITQNTFYLLSTCSVFFSGPYLHHFLFPPASLPSLSLYMKWHQTPNEYFMTLLYPCANNGCYKNHKYISLLPGAGAVWLHGCVSMPERCLHAKVYCRYLLLLPSRTLFGEIQAWSSTVQWLQIRSRLEYIDPFILGCFASFPFCVCPRCQTLGGPKLSIWESNWSIMCIDRNTALTDLYNSLEV